MIYLLIGLAIVLFVGLLGVILDDAWRFGEWSISQMSKRSWRFSVRELLLVVTIAGVLLGILIVLIKSIAAT